MLSFKTISNDGTPLAEEEQKNFVSLVEKNIALIRKQHPDATDDEKNSLLINRLNKDCEALGYRFKVVAADSDIIEQLANALSGSDEFNRANWYNNTGKIMARSIEMIAAAGNDHMPAPEIYTGISSCVLHTFARNMDTVGKNQATNERERKAIERLNQLSMRLVVASIVDHVMNLHHGDHCPVAKLRVSREELLSDMMLLSQDRMDDVLKGVTEEINDLAMSMDPAVSKH